MRWKETSNILNRRFLIIEKLVIKKGDDEKRKKLLKNI